ncbi:MAG: FecR domain-containing protein [Clostridia bacterium]|nr:FecR domain-containing protein [Clostridia bacterium]
MKNRIAGKLLVFLLILLLSASAGLEAFAESYTASTMRLLHYEGSVEIEDASGKPRFVMENVRFSSGEAMLTGENSTASVGLDDNKILTMDQDSRVEFFKQNNAMKLTLTKGAILLDVQKKLDENETLDIQTSTMSVGIRGTIVYLSEQADEKAPDNIVTTLGVLEGTAQVTYQDASNTTQSLPVPAGFEISIAKAADAGANGDASLIDPPAATRLKDDIVPEFVQKMLNADPLFQDRVAPALSESYPADGNWVWTGTISLVAQSASKLYDGLPLSRSSDVLVYGLPEFFSIRVSASGSQTNVGSSANVISGFAILNAMGEDVTSHFPSIETIPGQLVVSPAPLTVWTGSAHKVYDGEPLTNPEAKLITVSGYEEDMPAWQNASFVAPGASGGQIMYALNGSTWVHGTNPLTGETREIELRAGQKMTVRLSDDQTKSSIELLIENITEEEIPEEILRLYAENPELLSAACAETGWNRALIENRIAQLPPAEQTAAEWNGLRTERSTANGLIRNSADVRITIDTDITSYNGRVLGSQEARITEVHIDESIVVTATGQQTEVGQSPNTYTIDWGNADPGNYILSEELGTLTVYAPEAKTYSDPVTFTAASAKKVYDGTALEADGFEVTGLPEGFYAQAAVRGSQTESGSSENIIGEYAILDESGQNVTAQFTNITVKNGVLTVEPLQLGFKLTGDTVEYAGGIVFPDILLVYENGAHAGETVTGSSLMVGAAQTLSAPPPSLQRVYPLFTGDIALLTISGAGTDAGTYTLTGSFSFPGSVASNFDLPVIKAEYTVNPVELFITTSSAAKVYDGTALTSSEVSVTGLLPGDHITVTATGSLSIIGKALNTYTIDWGETNPDNYIITETLGTLEVTSSQMAILFTAASDEKAYDGTALENAVVTVSGLPAGFTFTATASGSQTDAGSSENSVSSYAILKDGIDVTASFTDISTVSGTLTVTPAEATVTTGSAVKAYDGTELTNPEASIEGLASGETASVTATGAITEIGTAINTYSIDWGETNPANYTVEEHLGTLEVTISSAEINITAASAEKVYDGTPLADDSFTVTGLPDGLTCTAVVQGSQTDAGESSNVIVSYQILNAEYADVTDSFASVALNDGLLKITPAAAVLTTASASKAYDGTPLTRNEGAVNGLVNGETVVLSFTGTITDIGSVDNTCTIDWGETNPDNYALTENLGTLEITVSTAKITFTAASAAKAYDGTELTDSFVTASGLPDGFTFEAEVTGSQKNAGDSENVIVSYKIFNQDNEDVTGNFTSIATVNGKLTVTPAAAVISTGSASKAYDGTALSSAEASITGLASGETVTLTASGTITEIGKADNTYTIDWGTVNKDNYTVTENLGTLEVTPNDGKIVITSGSSSAAYSPMGLINSDYTVEGLPDGFTAEVSVTGELNTVGSGSNTISGYTIYKDGEDKTANFTNVELKEGTLTLTKAKINVWSKSESFSYDGKSHSPSIQWQGVYGSDNPKGTDLSFSDVEWVKDAGEHKPAFTPTLTRSDLLDKYEIGDVTFGTITITPAELSISTGSASKPYDGSPLTCGDVTVNGLMGLDEITVNCNGSITEMGTAKNTYAIDWGSVNSSNYTVTDTLGTLEVTEPLTVTLTAASAEKAYDGTALENSSVTAEGLPAGYTVEASASGSQTDAGSSANTVNDGYIIRNAANEDVTSTFTVTKVDGTLKVTPLDVTVTIGNNEFTYDVGYHFVDVSASSTADVSGELLGDTAYRLKLPDAMVELTFSNPSRAKDAGSWPLSFSAITWNYGNQSNYNIITVPGSLTMNKRPVTVRTGSAEKVYDGTPLVNAEATVENGIEGLTATANGSITDAGSVQNTYTLSLDEWYTANLEITEVLGTLTVKPIDATVTIADSVFTYDNAYHSAEVSASSTADVSGELLGDTGYRLKLPDAMVELTFSNPSRAKDAGSWPLSFSAITWNYGNQSNYNIITVPGSLTMNKRPVTVRTGSAEKVYDGTPLVNAEATVENGITGLTATATGTITNAGSVQNTYTLNMDEWYTANLEITEDLGTLRVDPTPITVTARSESKVYDGSLLPENTDAPLIDGTLYEYIYAEHSEATITDAGEVTRECTIVWGEANPDNYDVTMVPGHLTITPLEVVIDLGGYNYDSSDGSWSYDGNFHGPNVSASCADEGFTVSQISDNDWEIIWSSRGDVIQVHAEGGGAEEGATYIFDYSVSVTSGKEGNYSINVTGKTLTISVRRIYITVPDDPPEIYVPVPDDTPKIIVDAP